MSKKTIKRTGRKTEQGKKLISKKSSISDSRTDAQSEASQQDSCANEHDFMIAMSIQSSKEIELINYSQYQIEPKQSLFEKLLTEY